MPSGISHKPAKSSQKVPECSRLSGACPCPCAHPSQQAACSRIAPGAQGLESSEHSHHRFQTITLQARSRTSHNLITCWKHHLSSPSPDLPSQKCLCEMSPGSYIDIINPVSSKPLKIGQNLQASHLRQTSPWVTSLTEPPLSYFSPSSAQAPCLWLFKHSALPRCRPSAALLTPP